MCAVDSSTCTGRISLFREFDAALMHKVRLFIRGKVMNPDDVEDLVQCTFLEALRNAHKFRNDSLLLTWLCGIAMNLIRSHFRRLYSQPLQKDLEECDVLDISDNSDVFAEVDGRRQLLRAFRAIATLPLNMQEVIRVSLEMEGNYLDTATALGVPIGTVRSRLSRAREQLRWRLAGSF